MIDRSRAGQRVRVHHSLWTAYRHYAAGEEGTIVYVLTNSVGKTLVEIAWDTGTTSPLFEQEFIVIPDHEQHKE